MRFHEHIISSFIPDFVEIQQKSFYTLLKKGLIKELSKINPIIDSKHNLELFFYPQYYQLTRPTLTTTEAISKLKTYASKLYVPVQLTNKRTKKIKLHWFLLCDLPLMTKRGHFIINGCPRVVVNQLMRSPGIYYQHRIIRRLTTTVNRFYADIIPSRGTWLRLECNNRYSHITGRKKQTVWARMKRIDKISGFLFLYCFKPKEWFHLTNATDDPTDSTIVLKRVYPFITFLKVLFFQHSFKKKKKKSPSAKNKNKEESFGEKEDKKGITLRREIIRGERGNIASAKKKGIKKYEKKKKVIDWEIDTEEVVKEVSKKKNETIEQVLEDTNYPFAFLFLESGADLRGLERVLTKPENIDYRKNIKYKKFTEYTAEEFVMMGILFLYSKFLNPKSYSLGFQGRLRLNQKLGVKEKKYTLTCSDIFHAFRYLIFFQKRKWLTDDIDNLKNKRVKASGELIENQLTTGLLVLQKQLIKKIDKMEKISLLFFERKEKKRRLVNSLTLKELTTTKPINGTLRVFFGSNPLSQYLDQTNPLADITHKRRVSCLGPGGLSRETAGMAVRNIHPTHYGRICPIETPEGRNAGLVNSIALYARTNIHGYLETPFYNVYQGQIQKQDCSTYNKRPVYLSAEQEEGLKMAPGDSKSGFDNFLQAKSIPIKSRTEYSNEEREKVEYIAMSPIQMISVATSLIPFLEHDDATRALMGSNMQRQGIPTIFRERPIVGTGLEARVAAESGHVVQSRNSGYVSYASGKKIVILEKSYKKNFESLKRNHQDDFFLTGDQNPLLFLSKEKKRKAVLLKKSQSTDFFLNPFSFKKNKLAYFFNTKDLAKKRNDNWVLKNIKTFYPFLVNGKLNYPPLYNYKYRLYKIIVNQLQQTKQEIKEENFVESFQYKNCLSSFQKINRFRFSSKVEKKSFGFFKKKESFGSVKKKIHQDDFFFKGENHLFSLKKNNVEYEENLKKYNFDYFLTVPSFFQGKRIPNLSKNKQVSFKKNKQAFFFNTKDFSPQSHQSYLYEKPYLKLYKDVPLKEKSKDISFLDSKTESLIILFFIFLVRRKNAEHSLKKNTSKEILGKKYHETRRRYFLTGKNFSKPLRGENKEYVIGTKKKNRKNRKSLSYISYLSEGSLLNGLLFKKRYDLSDLKMSRFTLLRHNILHGLRSLSKTLNGYLPTKNPKDRNNRKNIKDRNNKNTLVTVLKGNGKFLAESKEYSLESYRRSNQATCLSQRPSVSEGEWVQKGDLLADCASSVLGDLSVGKNILVAYMPWQGYNFEDAILISERLVSDDVYTSIHIERYSIAIRDTEFGVEKITKYVPGLTPIDIVHLDDNGIGKVGSWLEEGEVLVGKTTPIETPKLSPHLKLVYDILELEPPDKRDTSLRVPKRIEGKIINVEILETKNIAPGISFDGPGCVHVFFAEKLRIQVGDKVSGRHGNKGIVSKIVPLQDMPYLPNGTPVDMVLNPLGVPSRMNVGQVFEALLGLAGLYLNESFKIRNFSNSYGKEGSRSLVYSKLYQARLKSGENWLFNPSFPGKTRVFDGRTGESFDQLITVGQSYMLKLIHLVDHKIHARSTGPYSLITQQPLKGRKKHGGQRVGEMEVWALQGFGAAYTLQEILTIKSDDILNRKRVFSKIFKGSLNAPNINLRNPEAFKVLVAELQSLSLDLEFYDKFTPINLTDFIVRDKIKKETFDNLTEPSAKQRPIKNLFPQKDSKKVAIKTLKTLKIKLLFSPEKVFDRDKNHTILLNNKNLERSDPLTLRILVSLTAKKRKKVRPFSFQRKETFGEGLRLPSDQLKSNFSLLLPKVFSQEKKIIEAKTIDKNKNLLLNEGKTSFLDPSTLQILLYLTAKEIKKPKKQLIKNLKSRFLTELPEQKKQLRLSKENCNQIFIDFLDPLTLQILLYLTGKETEKRKI